jgi:hypothetical protein
VAVGAGLLENGGSAFGIFLLQRILPPPGNGSLAVHKLRDRTAEAQQQGAGQQQETQVCAVFRRPEMQNLSNSQLLCRRPVRLARHFRKAHSGAETGSRNIFKGS